MPRPLHDLKRVEISHFELEDTIVALICTNPWKTSNKILFIVVFSVVWQPNFLHVILYKFM